MNTLDKSRLAAANAAGSAPSASLLAARVIDSRELFQHGGMLHIDHAGQRYVLRVTRENKPILTK